jgi:hypothetical protein
MTRAKKKSFLSAPISVSGALRERKTGVTLRSIASNSPVRSEMPDEIREIART